MIERTRNRLGLYPQRLFGDTACGGGEMLGWLVHEQGIEPHIPVFDKSKRRDVGQAGKDGYHLAGLDKLVSLARHR